MTKTEQTRLTHWRFKVIQRAVELRCVARTCRHFGLSRNTFYKWRRRFAENGLAGLCDRPRAPHRSPRATPAEVVAKILYLRENYHFGGEWDFLGTAENGQASGVFSFFSHRINLPEPGTVSIFALGLLGLACSRRRFGAS